jgi:hypothetical protein
LLLIDAKVPSATIDVLVYPICFNFQHPLKTVVVNAVRYEPVSAVKFPVLAQFTGNFGEKEPVLDDYTPIPHGKSIAYGEIPGIWSREFS